ncbi:hypothetical protein GTQ34_13870 [Muricauda sp. JGD-17]|uniref:DUF6734 domain-containing protein n=1 Tax=Flagellimonas ochracea TaxID=2696472 RepID=A0A964WYK9_9FLAO|nr:DUF6734 family protein [Allomuricauda ochracea]NAY93007.1 hypothetical protein [Allomuricauda ochracea]
MKIVQTFWTGDLKNGNHLDFKAGWTSAEYHWMSWALSCLTLRRHYDQVELYTDSIGKKILIDNLNLPYTKVHEVFDESFKARRELFSLAKIKTYGLQNEPFIHVDGDIYIWRPFPDYFSSAGLIASNPEKDLFFNKEILEAVHEHFDHIPDYLIGVHRHEHIYASNAGILGGSNLQFIQKYCDSANVFIDGNTHNLDLVSVGGLNWFIEQISLYYLALAENVPISYLIKEPESNPLYPDFWRFSDIPFVDLIHPVGGCKRELYVLNHLSKRLRMEFPSFYYKVLNLIRRKGPKLLNQIYYLMEVDSGTDLQGRTKSSFKQIEQKDLVQRRKGSFKKSFGRTLNLIGTCDKKSFEDLSSLSGYLERRKTDTQSGMLSEVFDLERVKYTMLLNLSESSYELKTRLYQYDLQRYEMTAVFFKKKGWMDCSIKLVDRVKLVKQKWDWNIKLGAAENEQDCIISLSPDILNVDIMEMRHDGFDAILLSELKEGPIIFLATSLTKYFDGNMLVENEQYQHLLFETIKRMAFENIIEIM